MGAISLELYRARFGFPTLVAAAEHALRHQLSLRIHDGSNGSTVFEHVDSIASPAFAAADPGSLYVHTPCEAEITREAQADGAPAKWRARLRLGAETVLVGSTFLSGDAAEYAAIAEAHKRGFTVVGATYTVDRRVLDLGGAQAKDC